MERMGLQSKGGNNAYGSVPLSVDLAMSVKRSMNSYGRVLAWVVVMLVGFRVASRIFPHHELSKPPPLAAQERQRYCEDIDATECARLAAPNATTGELPMSCQPNRGESLALKCPRSCGNCAVMLSDCKALIVLEENHCDDRDRVGEICANDGDRQTQSYCTWATKGSGSTFRGSSAALRANSLKFECAMCADTTMTSERRVLTAQLAEGIRDEQDRGEQSSPRSEDRGEQSSPRSEDAIEREVEGRVEAAVEEKVKRKLQDELAIVDERVGEKISAGTAFVNAKMEGEEQRFDNEIQQNMFRGGKGRRIRANRELAAVGLNDMGYESARQNAFIPGYYGPRETFFQSLQQALEACNGYTGCGGVTLENGDRYSLRNGANCAPSPSGETSWLKKANPWRQQAAETRRPGSVSLPRGSWEQTARNVMVRPLEPNEVGPDGKAFELHATLRRADGSWQDASSRFSPGDSFGNENGSLVHDGS